MNTNTGTTTSARQHHVCPWWLAYTFDNPLRRLIDPAQKALNGIVEKGMTVMDIGCGFGHFTIGAARMVGDTGRVIAADLQEIMLAKTMARARRCGVAGRITLWRCQPDRIGYADAVDAVIAANVLHETPNIAGFLKEIFLLLRPGGKAYVTEPGMHIGRNQFSEEINLARYIGFQTTELPRNMFVRRAIFVKTEEEACQ